MSNWASIIICVILSSGVLCLITLMVVAVVDAIKDMKRKQKEWEREDELRGWRKR